MVGLEALSLQGLPVDELLLTRETEDQLADLAGNAMSSTVVGTVILCALIVGMSELKPGQADAMDLDDSHQYPSPSSKITGIDLLEKGEINLSATRQQSLSALLSGADASARLCNCEGRDDITTRPVQRCQDCGATACSKCGGRPEHNFSPIDVVVNPRTQPSQYRAFLKDQLPMSVTLTGIDGDILERSKRELTAQNPKETTWMAYSTAILAATSGPLTFKEEKRQETWLVIYDSPTAKLELHLHPIHPEWILYAKPRDDEPANGSRRVLFSRPIARLAINKNLFDGEWHLAIPTDTEIDVNIEGMGSLVPAWEAKLGLEGEGQKTKTVWSQLKISYTDMEEEDKATHQSLLSRDIAGTYTLFDQCGTANAALHKKDDTPKDELPLFLFLDPLRCGKPEDDYFVLSSNTKRCEYGESRTIVARFDSSWRPGSSSGLSVARLHIQCQWIPVKKVQLVVSDVNLRETKRSAKLKTRSVNKGSDSGGAGPRQAAGCCRRK